MAKKPNASPKPNHNPAPAPALGPGIQLPPGVTLQHPLPPFPVDLQQAFERARKSGRYFIAVAVAEENGDLKIDCHRSGTFSPDWLLRGWQAVLGDITSGKLLPPDQAGGAADEPEGD